MCHSGHVQDIIREVLTEETGKGVGEAGQGRGVNRARGDFRESASLSPIPGEALDYTLGFRVSSNLRQKNWALICLHHSDTRGMQTPR